MQNNQRCIQRSILRDVQHNFLWAKNLETVYVLSELNTQPIKKYVQNIGNYSNYIGSDYI